MSEQEIIDYINKDGGLRVVGTWQSQGGMWGGSLMRDWDQRRGQHFERAKAPTFRELLIAIYQHVLIAKKLGNFDKPGPHTGSNGGIAGGDYSDMGTRQTPQHEQVRRPLVRKREEAPAEPAPIRERVRMQPGATVDVSPPAAPPVVRQRTRIT